MSARKQNAKRRHVPLAIQLRVALRQAGLNPDNVNLDHNPALEMRVYDESTGLYEPDQHDERYLVFLPKEVHDVKTFGTKIPMSGDISKIARAKRLERAHKETMERLLSPSKKRISIKKARWPKRKFESRVKR